MVWPPRASRDWAGPWLRRFLHDPVGLLAPLPRAGAWHALLSFSLDLDGPPLLWGAIASREGDALEQLEEAPGISLKPLE